MNTQLMSNNDIKRDKHTVKQHLSTWLVWSDCKKVDIFQKYLPHMCVCLGTYVCMYVCMYVCTHTHTHVCVCVCVYLRKQVTTLLTFHAYFQAYFYNIRYSSTNTASCTIQRYCSLSEVRLWRAQSVKLQWCLLQYHVQVCNAKAAKVVFCNQSLRSNLVLIPEL